jgi:hypothetical protein
LDGWTKPNSRNEATKLQEKIMKKTISILAIAGLILALAPAAQASDFTDDAPTSWRIAFVTTATGTPDSSVITTYDTFVNNAGVAVPLTYAPSGTTYKVLGSTLATSAKVNTGTLEVADTGYDSANDVPIYTTNGDRIAANNDELWGGTIQNIIDYDNGTVIVDGGGNPAYTWTGTKADGSSAGNGSGISQDMNAMGSGSGHFPEPTDPTNYIVVVRGGKTNSTWIYGVSDHEGSSARFLGLSEVIPEPATMSLLAIGGVGLLLKRRRRRA